LEKVQEVANGCFPVEVNGVCLKPLQSYLKLISRKWMIFLIMAFPADSTPLRYSEIQNHIKQRRLLSKRISDTTVSARLQELVATGILDRRQYVQIPPRVEYRLTEKGKELQQSLQPLMDWAVKSCHADQRS